MRLIEIAIYTTDPTHTAEWVQDALLNAANGRGVAFHCVTEEQPDQPCTECMAYAQGTPELLWSEATNA